MDSLTIIIQTTSEGGYQYDIYNTVPEGLQDDPMGPTDGGLCTTTLLNALGMATAQAEDLIKSYKGEECPGCGKDMTGQTKHESAHGNGELCGTCFYQETKEGDFIGAR